MTKIPLVLWGGTDVDSKYYNKPKSKFAQHPNKERDEAEYGLVQGAIRDGHPIIGVCRGAQFLCVINGGELYQHSVPHEQCHSIMTNEGEFKDVSAGHHQVMKPKGNFVVYGWNPNEVKVWDDDSTSHMEKDTCEVVWYPETKCLAIQPHPEYERKGHPFIKWLDNLIKSLDIDYSFS